MESVKLERLNNAFMEQLNIILGTETKNPILKKVIVNAVKITNDLSYAKVYFTCFDEDRNIVLKELKDSAGYLRHELSVRVEIRHTPELTFLYDETLEYAKKIEEKIKKLHDN